MSLTEEITKALNADPHGEPRRLAMVVLDKVTKADLVDLIAAEVSAVQRTAARREERSAFAETFRAKAAKPPVVVTDSLRSLFRTPFKLGDGTEVNWLHATADQHRQRMAHLSKIRDGIDRTIDQHREAVSLIESAGVSCLAELTEGVAQAA